MVLNSLSFCLSAKLLISPSYLNEVLAGYSNLGCRLFSFITHSSPAEFNRSQKDPIELQLRNSFFWYKPLFYDYFLYIIVAAKIEYFILFFLLRLHTYKCNGMYVYLCTYACTSANCDTLDCKVL